MRTRRGAIAAGIGQIDWRFIARNQALIAVGGRRDDRRQRAGVLQQSADVPQRHLAEAGVHVAGEQWLPALPQALVGVHAAAVIAEQRLGHEGHALAVLIRDVADHVLVQHHVVGRFDQRVEALIDFALAGGGDFVVVALDIEADLDHRLDHFGAQVLIMIGGRHGEISFLVARTVAEVVLPHGRSSSGLPRRR